MRFSPAPFPRLALAVAVLLACGIARADSARDQERQLASQLSTGAGDPGGVDPAYGEAEQLYLKGNAGGALQQLAALLAREAELNSRTRIRARNLRGLIFFQQRNLQGAVLDFESAAQIADRSLQNTDSLLHLTRYNFGNALFQVNRAADAFETLGNVNADALDSDTRMRFHHLYANVLSSREQPLEALVNYLLSARLSQDPGARDSLLNKAAAAARRVYRKDAVADLERLRGLQLEPKSAAGVAARIFMARGFLYSGDPEKAKSLLKDAIEDADPSHPLRAKAEELLSDLGRLGEVDPRTIGVLLPLSGKFARFGRLCLNSILMAFAIFEEMNELPAGFDFRIAIRDSGESPELAQERFSELVKEEKSIAVIGPLLSRQFGAVAQKAQEFGVPLLGLSQRVEAGASGSFVFPVALSPAQQIEMIVAQAIGTANFRRFAILAPSDSFGDAYVSLFWDSVEKLGGEVVGIERYEPRSTDFRDEMSRLLGLDATGARRMELEELERRKALFAATLKVKGKLRQRLLKSYDLKAVVDFDAVFIPDDPATVGQIAPSFAVHDVDSLPMLGINTWNTPEIVQRAGRYLQRSLFVDGFFPGSKDPKAQRFIREYQQHFKSTPGTIEVQAYDAARILIEALGAGAPTTRARLREQLLATEKFPGISGDYRFTEDGVLRTAHLLTVRGNSIAELSTNR